MYKGGINQHTTPPISWNGDMPPRPNRGDSPSPKLAVMSMVELDLNSDRSAALRGETTMAQTNINNNQKIIDSCSLIAFARTHGKMQVGTFSNKETGEVFKSCIFTNPTDQSKCFVAFSSKMGELTPREIAAAKDELRVVQLESGHYYLCEEGANAWEDVDLGI